MLDRRTHFGLSALAQGSIHSDYVRIASTSCLQELLEENRGVAKSVECLPSTQETLDSILSTA